VSQGNEGAGARPAKESGGFLPRSGSGEESMKFRNTIPAPYPVPGTRSNSATFRLYSLRGYRYGRWCAISCWRSASPPRPQVARDGFVSGTNPMRRKSPLRTIGAWGSSQDQATMPAERSAPQTRLLPEPGHHMARADRAGIRERVPRRSRSNRSARSLLVPRNARITGGAIPARATRNTGLVARSG